MNKLILFFLCLILISCSSKKADFTPISNKPTKMVEYFDATRNRKIPVALFYDQISEKGKKGVLIFSHGYGRNDPKSYLFYNDLLGNLSRNGYFVVSIQHELETDDFVPLEGKPQIVRRPNWNRGSENIGFVLKEIKKNFPDLNYEKVVVAGHSNGGDMSVLFVDQHPDLVWKLITLDQRRYPFPKFKNPKIYSLRSSDQPADEGVLPSIDDQKKLGMTIIKLQNTIHNDMDESGTEEQKEEIIANFLQFLKE